MNMAPTIICSMIVSVLAPPLIQIVGEILGELQGAHHLCLDGLNLMATRTPENRNFRGCHTRCHMSFFNLFFFFFFFAICTLVNVLLSDSCVNCSACILTPILLPGSSPAKCPTTLGKKRKMRWKPNTKPCKCEAPAKDPEFAAFLERESLGGYSSRARCIVLLELE